MNTEMKSVKLLTEIKAAMQNASKITMWKGTEQLIWKESDYDLK